MAKENANAVWHVAWAEFDGWEYELYTGSEIFKTKEAAVTWVEHTYNEDLEDKFGVDPDLDDEDDEDDDEDLNLKPLHIDPGSFEASFTVEFPECENFYSKWVITRTVLK